MDDSFILTEFKALDLLPQRSAVILLRNFLAKNDNPEETLKRLLKQILKSSPVDNIVDKTLIEREISTFKKSLSPSHHVFGYQSAFEYPRFVFDSSNRTLIPSNEEKSTIGTANDKCNSIISRYKIVKQSLLHTSLFKSSSVHFAINSDQKLSITSITSLISKEDSNVIVLGLLDLDGDTLTIEDDTGIVNLDISGLQQAIGIFSVGSVVLVNGDYRDKTVYATIIGHPPSTQISDFFANFWRLPTDPYGWNLSKNSMTELHELLETQHSSSLILVFSDVWIDIPSVLDNFNHVLSQFDKSPPNMIIISGSFTSKPYSINQLGDFQRLFSRFCDKIFLHSEIKKFTQFVFIPSLVDIASPKVYPRPSFPDSIQKIFPEAKFLSNPCRIRFMDQTITIFRDDIMKRVCSCAVIPVSDEDVHINLVTTLLNQRHMCPIDQAHAPISWSYDFSFNLFPPPDALILCDSCFPWKANVNDVCSMNPGQFGNGGTYGLYYPYQKETNIQKIN